MLAFPYMYLHVRSATKGYALLRHRSVQHPLHSWTIITSRMDLAAWLIALITTCVAVGRQVEGEMVHLRVDVFICTLGL